MGYNGTIGNAAHTKIRDYYLKSHGTRAWSSFLQSIEGNRQNVRISYVNLATVLKEVGMDLGDVVQIEWPDQQFQELAAICEQLDEDVLSMISHDLQRFIPTKFSDIKAIDPLERVTFVWQVRYRKAARKSSNQDVDEESVNLYSLVSIPLEKMVEISKVLHLSLHWILCYDGPVYSKNPTIDLILEQFSFVSQGIKEGFLRSLKKLAEQIGRGE